jgi:hypothetical protein
VFVTEDMRKEQWLYLFLGQYVGFGHRRSFGWGRYILESAQAGRTMPRVGAMSSLVELACRQDNLEEAYAEIADDEEIDVERLVHLREQLLNDEYRIPTLHKQTLNHEDGSSRLLQVPPFFDRVAQRAVGQVLTPALDTLMYTGSFGFRKGKSRHLATQMIQNLHSAETNPKI